MKNVVWIFFIALRFLGCATEKKRIPQNWKVASNQVARSYAEALGPLAPEYVADLGFPQFESKVTPYSEDLEEKRYLFAVDQKSKIEDQLDQKKLHPEFITDLNILLDHLQTQLEGYELAKARGVIPFIPVSELVYGNIKEFLGADSSRWKVTKAKKRFKAYVRGQENSPPLVEGVIAYTKKSMDHLASLRKIGFWPTKREIENYLNNSDQYLSEIFTLLSKTKKNNWREDFETFKEQEASYRLFLRKQFLPYARKSQKHPAEIYSFILRDYGVKADPKELIKIAKIDYAETYAQFKQLAELIGDKYKLKSSSPLDVVSFLSSRKFQDENELLSTYNQLNEEIFTILKEKKLISINEKPTYLIRLATSAESQSIPAPHFISSPLIGKNKDTPSQFVITPASGEANDFNFKEAALNLTAHEANPGHGLQYHLMKERGTTLMRSWFAFNSANVEGWALYAEDIIYPYISLEAKFITLQRRLWRQARMFLDPELNLGLIGSERVKNLYTKELGFSEAFALSELKRYSFIMPGQAPSYYFGYKSLITLKSQLKVKLGEDYSDLCFNDAILNLGVLPLSEIYSRLLNNLECLP